MNKLSTLSALLRNASLFEEAVETDILKYSAEVNFETGQTVRPEYGNQDGDLSRTQTVRPPSEAWTGYSEGGERYTKPAEKLDKNNNIITGNGTIDAGSTIKNSRIKNDAGAIISSDISATSIESLTNVTNVTITDSAIHHSVINDPGKSNIVTAAITDSQITGQFAITNSVAITNSTLENHSGGTCKLDDHVTITNSNCKFVNLSASKVTQSNLENIESAAYSTFESSSVGGAKKIYDSKFINSSVGVVNAISSTCLNIKDMFFQDLICTLIQDTTSDGRTRFSIKGTNKATPVYIQYANLSGNPVISGAAQIIGFPNQYADISGSAQIMGNAKVTGHVKDNAVIYGNAKVEGKCTISGDCRVGGNARMISGEYTTGEYLTGEHSGGSNSWFGSAVESATEGVQNTLNSAYDKVTGRGE